MIYLNIYIYIYIYIKKCRTNAHLNYFGNRVCSSWNALPFIITSCITLTLFREKLIHTKCINHVIVITY